MPHSSSSSPVTYLPVHITFPSFFSLVSRESWRNQYINLSLFFLTSLFLLAWISGFLSVDHDHDLGWGVARRAVGFAELWGHPIRFRQVDCSGVLLLWQWLCSSSSQVKDDHDHDHDLGWEAARRAVGFVELWGHRIQFCQFAYLGVLLLWLGFKVGLKLELGVGLLLWLGFEVGMKLEFGGGFEVGRFLSFP